jgi:glycine/D-amino acid oxidase-like deaminating enzyme
MVKVIIVGAGIVGAAIAYELSLVPGLEVTLIEENLPASGSTGAALGVLMGIISHKTKGKAWKLREKSIKRYETLIPELESITGKEIPFNRQGILKLLLAEDDLSQWKRLQSVRQAQGWELELWSQDDVSRHCPHLNSHLIMGAIYSPSDRQVNPSILTEALVTGAAKNGVDCQIGVKLKNCQAKTESVTNSRYCFHIQTNKEKLEVDWLIISAGIGSSPLTESLNQYVDIRPVLGQALQLSLDNHLGKPDWQPVITGDDVHLVPIGNKEYWLGATIEFPDDTGQVIAKSQLLEQIKQKAVSFCPSLAEANIIHTWSGKRPRPQGQPAPVIGFLPGYSNVLLATGHYRNGFLLAPATGEEIKAIICSQ